MEPPLPADSQPGGRRADRRHRDRPLRQPTHHHHTSHDGRYRPLVITTGGGVADDATYTYVSRPEGHEFPVDPCPARPTATKDGSPPKLVPCPHGFAGWRGYDPRVAEHHHAHRRTAALPVSEQVEVGRQAVGEAAQGRGSRRRGQRRATRAVGSRCGWPSTRRRTGRVRWPLRRTWPARPRNPVLMGEFMAAYQEAREMPVFTILLMLRLHAGDELNAQAGVGTWCGVRAGPSADVCAEDRLSAGDPGVGRYKQCPQQCGRVPAAEPEFGEEAPVLQAGEGVLADCPLGRDQLVDLPAPTGRTMVWETSLAATMSQRRWSWQRTARTMVAIFPGGSLRHRERIFLSWPCRRSPMSPRGGRGQVQTGLVDSFFGVPAGRLFFFTSSSTSAGGQLVTPGGIGTGRW